MYLSTKILGGETSQSLALAQLPKLQSYLLKRVGNRADAEDLVQEVGLRALPRLRTGEPEPVVRAYLYAVARSVVSEFWAARLTHPERELPDNFARPTVDPTPKPAAEQKVIAVLDRLPDHYRMVLELRFLRGYSLREAAQVTGRSVGAVKLLQLRALRAAAKSEPSGGVVGAADARHNAHRHSARQSLQHSNGPVHVGDPGRHALLRARAHAGGPR